MHLLISIGRIFCTHLSSLRSQPLLVNWDGAKIIGMELEKYMCGSTLKCMFLSP